MSRSRRRPAVLTTLALVAALLTGGPARAADTTVGLDLSQLGSAPNRAGAGFLYGLSQDGSAPADSLLQPLAPTLFRGGGARIDGHGWIGDGYIAGNGYQVRITSALAQAGRVTAAPYQASYHLLVSDLFGADTTQPSNTVYPCDNGDCSNWKTFVDKVVADVQAARVDVVYDIWNEPEGTSFWPRGVNSTQYFQMWDTAVREIRRLAPTAKIAGPSYGSYHHDWLDTFLTTTKADGTLPDVMAWHFSADPVADAGDMRALLSAKGIAQLPLTIPEYLWSQQQNAGYTAWYLDRLSASGIAGAAHAIWTDCCTSPSLDSVLSGGQPTGQWWVYRAYAQLPGRLVAATSGGGTTVAAGLDATAKKVMALVGNSSGQGGTVTVQVNGLAAAPWLQVNGKVHALIQRIPDQANLAAPISVLDSDVTPSNGALSLPISVVSGTDAYTVTLTPGNGTSGPIGTTTIVDGTVTDRSGLDYFSYGANWGVTNGVSDMYQGTANWSYTAGATATFQFRGSQVALHAVRDIDQGIMSIAVDGGAPVTVDGYASTRNASGTVWTSPILPADQHTLTIVNTGQKNAASSGNNMAIDRADVYQADIVDANAPGRATYSSDWGLATGISDMYAGTANWSQTAGATATFTFTGNAVALHAVRDVDQEMIAVSLDNGPETTIDDYSPTRNASGIVWTSPSLASGSHTVKIRVTGTKNPSSTGYNTALDSFDVLTY